MEIVGQFIGAGQVYVFLSGQALFRTPGCPKWCPVEKTGQNGLFLEVFGKFDPLSDTVFNPNFKQ